MTSAPRAISFDLDDTLWSCEDVIARAEEAVHAWLATHYPRITDAHDAESMRQVRIRTAAARPDLQANLTRLRHETLVAHAHEAGYDPALADAAVEVFLAERHRVELYPDVPPVIGALAGRYRLVALTNGNADVHRAGVGHWFDLAVAAGDVGAPKPDPAMFRRACERLGIRSGELLHVGDDPLRDVHAARTFGARALWINRAGSDWPHGLQRPHHEAATLDALLELLPMTPASD